MSKKPIIGIACIANNRSIGFNNNLIFRSKNEMKFFRETTLFTDDPNKQNAIIMGRKTYQTLPNLLKGRINCILSRSQDFTSCEIGDEEMEELIISDSVSDLLEKLYLRSDIESIFVIGGEHIYTYFHTKGLFDKLILTIIQSPKINYGDSYFPIVDFTRYTVADKKCFSDIGTEIITNTKCSMIYSIYFLVKKSNYSISNITEILDTNIEEYQYLNLLKNILENGEERTTRNSKTISLYGVKMNFDISKKYPLLTTKKMYLKGILKELIWFISGNTNSKDLENDGVRIWQGNSSREYLDSIGLTHYEEGDCGPIYGFQWRHFNAKYRGWDKDYIGEGVDQLQNVIDLIRNNPTSRRIYMTGWNPCQLKEMALPPCHISYQFYVRNCLYTRKKFLDCMMYQRSGDIFLGVPFNIASTATLTYILANITDIHPGKISIVIGDAHIYENHIEQVKTQLLRTPYNFPSLVLKRKLIDIDDIKYTDFKVENYKYHPLIRAKMVA